jgi:hypothetical protein
VAYFDSYFIILKQWTWGEGTKRERGQSEREIGERTEICRKAFAREKNGARERGEVEGT